MQGKMAKALKNRASKQEYFSPSQLTLEGFETPFAQKLDAKNRWVQLAHRIPWDYIVTVYEQQMHNNVTGASNINPRVIIGSLIIKHMCKFSDAETVLQIQENMYMQYFIGYSSFSNEAPFDSSLFVEIRKRLGPEQLNAINEKIVELASKGYSVEHKENTDQDDESPKADQKQEQETTAVTDKEIEKPVT